MAVSPTIGGSAQRRLIPSADLRVENTNPASFGAGLGAGLQAVGSAGEEAAGALKQFQLIKQAEEDRLANFDRQTQFVKFGADQSTRLAESQRDLSGPAQDFTKTFMTDFDTGAADFLAKVPEKDRPAWEARFATLRAGVGGEALRVEFGQRDQWSKTTIGDSLGHLQNGAMSSPEKLDDWRKQGDDIIEASGLTEQDKLEYRTRWHAQVATAAATGDIQHDPEGAMQRLGGIDTRVTVITGDGGSAATDTVFNELVKQESGGRPHGGAGAVGPDTKWGNALGATQLLPGTAREMAQKLGVPYDERLLRGHSPEALAYQLKLGRAYFDQGLQKYNGDLRKALMYYHGGPDEKLWGPKTRAYADAILGRAGASESGRSIVKTDTVGTGQVDPRYADIPIENRVQLITQAQRDVDRQKQEVAVAEDKAHDEWFNGFQTELYDGKLGQSDIDEARKSGKLTDINEIARAQSIVDARTKRSEDLTNYNTAVATPGFQWNPYDPNHKDAAEAAVKARGGTPQAAFDVWQKTGILAPSGVVALRGGLVSTDSEKVQVTANLAGNMLRRNPNAFAGVEGGSDIEEAGLKWNHYTYDLGMDPKTAAARIARENTPEYKAKLKVTEPQMQAYRQQLRKTGADNPLPLFGSGVKFADEGARTVATQRYSELIVDQLAAGNDLPTARALAGQQLKRIYGVQTIGDQRYVVAYPPEKGYPPINGNHDYLRADAIATVQRETGRKDAPASIRFVVIPGVTDNDFRTGRPPRYRIVYSYLDKGGQKVYDTLPGFWAADTKHAAQTAQQSRQTEYRGARRANDDTLRRQLDANAEVNRGNPDPYAND